MKKKILIVCGILLSSGFAFAKTIDFDTVIKWNSLVIKTSLNDAGLFGESGYHYDVQATFHRILEDLLKKDTFSCRTATDVCLKHCNKSDLLRNGKGSSGRKCPEICKDFANALIPNNNKNITSRRLYRGEGGYDGDGKIYSDDKKFYALHKNDGFDVYETNSNKKIATLKDSDMEGEGPTGWVSTNIVSGNYAGWDFTVSLQRSVLDTYDEAEYWLEYSSLEYKYNSDIKRLEEYISSIEQHQTKAQEMMYKAVDNSDGLIQPDIIKSHEWYQQFMTEMYSTRQELYAIKNLPINTDSYKKIQEYKDDHRLTEISRRLSDFDNDMVDIKIAINNAECVRKLFKNDTDRFKYYRTSTKESAYHTIQERCGKTGLTPMSCSGECKKLGNDKVTCKIGSLSATFVFDSICTMWTDTVDDYVTQIGF